MGNIASILKINENLERDFVKFKENEDSK